MENMPKIIIVEDDPMISEIYNKKFSEAGFDVVLADSGEKVLNLAKEPGVDVILLDLIMPQMDGFEVLKRLRDGGYNQEIKVIIFSNLSQKEDHDKAVKLGADGFVIKSEFSPSELVAEIKRLMGQFSEQKRNEARLNGHSEKVEKEDNNSEKKRILFMEDEDIFQEMFGGKLRQEGFDVVEAKNGAWGLKEALAGNFDLFIVDMAMPAMNGDEIVAKLKLDERTKDVPVIILSASAKDEAARDVEDLGIEEFFIKTQITPTELFKRASEILDKK